MTEQLFLKVTASIAEVEKAFDELKGNVDKLGGSLDKQNKKLKDTGGLLDDVGKQGSGAFKLLNEATGGYAKQIVDVIKGLEEAQAALSVLGTAGSAILTGGIVAALIAIVAYWDDIEAAVLGTNTEIDKQLTKLENLLGTSERSVTVFEKQYKLAKLRGEATEGVIKAAKFELKSQIQLLNIQQQALKAKRDELVLEAGRMAVIKGALQSVAGGDLVNRIFGEDIGQAVGEINKTIQENEAAILDAEIALEEFGKEKEKATKKAKTYKQALDTWPAMLVKIGNETNLAGLEIRDFNKYLNETQFKDLADDFASAFDKAETDEAEREIRELEAAISDVRSELGELGKTLTDKEIVNIMQTGREGLEQWKAQAETTLEIAKSFSAGAAAAVRDVFNALYEQLQTGNAILDAFLNLVVTVFEQMITKLLTAFITEKIIGKGRVAANAGVSKANAVTAATQTAAALPFGAFLLPGLIAGALATVTGAFAGIAAFNTGGLVSGDKNLVRVNGNELILNPNQQATLYNLLKGNLPTMASTAINRESSELVVSTKLKGSDLLLTVERAKRKNERWG